MNEIRSCPGDRILVLGNHDGNAHGLRLLGFTVQHTLALCATDPPLAPGPGDRGGRGGSARANSGNGASKEDPCTQGSHGVALAGAPGS